MFKCYLIKCLVPTIWDFFYTNSNFYVSYDIPLFIFITSTLVYALTLGLLSSLLGDHLASIGDFIVFGSPVIEPGDSSQYFHIALSALLSFILAYSFRKSLDNWSYVIDYQIIGTIGVFILSTYYIIILYTRFSGGNPEVLALNTTFLFYIYVLV